MADFKRFAQAAERKFNKMAEDDKLYVVDISGDDVYAAYLAAFPVGSNPIFRQRTEHDCSCCRNFIKNIGNVVSLKDGEVTSVWDLEGLEFPYDVVAAKLSELLQGKEVKTIFLTSESRFGQNVSYEYVEGGGSTAWNHFWCSVLKKFQEKMPDAKRGEANSAVDVFRRGMEEITPDSVATVLDLIDSNAVYRGAEFREVLKSFSHLQMNYPRGGTAVKKSVFLWSNHTKPGMRLRNSAIGTLVQAISDGEDIEKAVEAFGRKMDPLNYKRPTTIVTKRMVEDAVFKLKDMGLESAIKRRYAKFDDVSVNDVIFVDNSARGKLKDGDSLTDLLMAHVKTPTVVVGKPEPISMEAFIKDVVPKAESIELKLETKHLPNFVSVTAAVDPNAGKLFKWDNQFAWSYDGDAADSVKQRVKKAGGNVDNAAMRVSLSWFNTDDLDLHCKDPRGTHIYYSNKWDLSGKQVLDVDMNAHSIVRDPVENLSWTKLMDGVYKVFVHQYNRRDQVDFGFDIEVENNGQIESFSYKKPVSGTVGCFNIHVKDGLITHIEHDKQLEKGSAASTDKWGVKTETLVPIETLITSPNHWSGQGVGNKHWFFILKDCKNPDNARGIYNEYLRGDLEKHRKVFELVGAKTKCAASDEQLSGVGFSSTGGGKVVVVVKGSKLNKSYEINF